MYIKTYLLINILNYSIKININISKKKSIYIVKHALHIMRTIPSF